MKGCVSNLIKTEIKSNSEVTFLVTIRAIDYTVGLGLAEGEGKNQHIFSRNQTNVKQISY